MANEIRNVIMLAVATMVVALIIPLAIGLLSDAGNTIINGTTTLADIADPSVVTLLTVLLPVIIIIVIVLLFLPRSGA